MFHTPIRHPRTSKAALLLSLTLAGLLHAPAAWAAAKQTVAIPIVMEEATVRGKIAVLESRRDARKTLAGLTVSVWSTKPAAGAGDKGERGATWERDRQLHETETDDLGLFILPALPIGDYLLEVSDVRFRLSVIAQSAERAGQGEPKVLLILLPKEVVAHAASAERS